MLGIEVVSELDSDSINSIAEYASSSICNTFPKLHFNYDDLFHEISSMPMFIANMPNGLAEASYFYKNSSIYFRDGMGLADLKKFAIHEIIHHLQEVKDEKNNLLRMGLCTFQSYKTIGMAINEAAVQIVSSYISDNPLDTVKYYGIEFSTISPNFYPLICNLLSQMCYIVGEDLLYDSVFYSNDNFKNRFIELCGKSTFYNIQNNLDKLLKIEEKIIHLNTKFEASDSSEKTIQKYQTLIEQCKLKIRDIFFRTQNLIFTSYFDNQFYKLQSDSDIEIYKSKFSIYQALIGTSDSYSYFYNYYQKKIQDIDLMYEKIINHKFLTTKSQNKFLNFLRSLLKIGASK